MSAWSGCPESAPQANAECARRGRVSRDVCPERMPRLCAGCLPKIRPGGSTFLRRPTRESSKGSLSSYMLCWQTSRQPHAPLSRSTARDLTPSQDNVRDNTPEFRFPTSLYTERTGVCHGSTTRGPNLDENQCASSDGVEHPDLKSWHLLSGCSRGQVSRRLSFWRRTTKKALKSDRSLCTI